MNRRIVFAALTVAALACGLTFSTFNPAVSAQSSDPPTLALGAPVGGFSSPLGIVNAADGSNRIFVVEQGGRIRIIKNGSTLTTPLLDISTRISCCPKTRLLGPA